MQKALVLLLKVVPLEVIYLFTAFIVPFYMVFNHRGYLATYHFFRRRMGRSVMGSVWHVYLNHLAFAQVVVDRFAIYAGRRFKVSAVGNEHFLQLSEEEGGFMMLSSHVGCFEMAGYTLQSERKTLYALVFAGETGVISQGRQQRFDHRKVVTVPVREDLSHVFTINDALDRGQVVTMPADRMLGSQKSVSCTFLGAEARFPMGPFATAVQKGVPVLAVTVVKVGLRHYSAHVTPLQVDPSASRAEQIRSLAQGYAHALEENVARHPHQWYNYFEFWTN